MQWITNTLEEIMSWKTRLQCDEDMSWLWSNVFYVLCIQMNIRETFFQKYVNLPPVWCRYGHLKINIWNRFCHVNHVLSLTRQIFLGSVIFCCVKHYPWSKHYNFGRNIFSATKMVEIIISNTSYSINIFGNKSVDNKLQYLW